jgi:hypothetical protein
VTVALRLFVVLACLGAYDTLYHHQWRARLPAMGPLARSELQLHAGRDFIYAMIFGTLPWFVWQGLYVIPLIALLVVEIVLTLWDFVVEDMVRKPLGGVYPGERVMHGIIGIVDGAAVAYLVPVLRVWWTGPSSLAIASPANSIVLSWALTFMAAGVLLSGVRGWCAAVGVPGSAWPW